MSYTSLDELSRELSVSDDDPEFLAMLERGEEVSRVQSAEQFSAALMKRLFEQPGIVGTPMRMEKLYDKVRFPPGQVTLYYGANGHGKSLFTSQVALDMAWLDEPVLICSFEMAPVATLARMVKQSAGTGTPTRRWAEAFTRWAQGRIWMYDRRGQAVAKTLLELVRYCALKHGIKHVVIDSLMKCVRGEEDYDGQKSFVERLCALALAADVHVHLVHHIRKPKDEHEHPNKFDGKGSGAIADQVDTAIGVWRNKRKEEARRQGKDERDAEPDALLIIDKNRHIEWEGKVALNYIPGAQAYTDVRGRPISYNLSPWMTGDDRVPT